jgi:hypothetical protein
VSPIKEQQLGSAFKDNYYEYSKLLEPFCYPFKLLIAEVIGILSHSSMIFESQIY